MTFTNMVTYWYWHECTHTWHIQVWEHVFMHGTCSNVYICDAFEHWHMLVFTHLLLCVTFPSTVICQHVQATSHMCHCQAESSNKWYRWILSHVWLNTYVYTSGVSENCHILIWCFWVPSHFGMSMYAHIWNVSTYFTMGMCIHTCDVDECHYLYVWSHLFTHMTFHP